MPHFYISGSKSTLVDEAIRKYFTEGHSFEVIMDLLATRHNISLSLSTLRRRLQKLGLTRRNNYTPSAIVEAATSEELRGAGQFLGYRAMWQSLIQTYSLFVRRDHTMHLVRELNASGLQNCSRRRFVRIAYHSRGPNEVWHIDGYDKLKPFGIAISGCIDGFSRKIMGLRCGKSNNDPEVIAQNYMQCVSEFGVVPMRLRTDCGTENGLMAALHCSLRSEHSDEFAGAKCMALQHPTSALKAGGLTFGNKGFCPMWLIILQLLLLWCS